MSQSADLFVDPMTPHPPWHGNCARARHTLDPVGRPATPDRAHLEILSVRQLTKERLIVFLSGKIGRWDSIWWNGELVSIGEALGRANDLLPSESAVCSHDEVLVPRQLERSALPSDYRAGAG